MSRQQRLTLAAVAALLALTVAPTVQAVEGQEHMWDDRMPPLFSMGDLPEDVLWMIIAFAMQNCRGEKDCFFLQEANDWYKKIIARKERCYADQRCQERMISKLNSECQPYNWATALQVESIPNMMSFLSCAETVEAYRRWYMRIATRMCEEVLCEYNLGVIYKRYWKLPPLWDTLSFRRDSGISPDAQTNWTSMVAERQASFFLAALLYENGVLGPRTRGFNAFWNTSFDKVDSLGKVLLTAPWWLEHQKNCVANTSAAITQAADRVTVAENSQEAVRSGKFFFDILQGRVPGTQSGPQSDTQSGLQSLALSLAFQSQALMSLARRVWLLVIRGQE